MNLLKFGVLLILVVLATMIALANAGKNIEPNKITINNGLETFKEEICIESFGNKTCSENTYVKCNGETYKVSLPTGFTVYRNIVKKEYVEKECNSEIINGKEKPSPTDRIKEDDIKIFNNKIIINIDNANWRKFVDSNSMDPLIDEGTTTIEIKPKNPDEIKVGDIIAYDAEGYDYAFVHRVVEIGNDEEGIYFITKGDNYYKEDNEKIRFGQIEGIIVGILY